MRSSDSYLVNVLDKLEETGLLDNTLVVRTADHGEMGLAHGGLRQKNFNFYEEATRVPLVYSNPKLYPQPLSSDALVSHVDFLPTLASLAAAPKSARAEWEGVDYSSLVLRPAAGKSAQDYVVFTYDDFQSGQASGPYPKPPNHIVSIREGRWKLAKYHDVEHKQTAAVGDVRPEDGSAGEDEPRLQGLPTHAAAGGTVPAAQTKAGPGRKDPPAAAVTIEGAGGLTGRRHQRDRHREAPRSGAGWRCGGRAGRRDGSR